MKSFVTGNNLVVVNSTELDCHLDLTRSISLQVQDLLKSLQNLSGPENPEKKQIAEKLVRDLLEHADEICLTPRRFTRADEQQFSYIVSDTINENSLFAASLKSTLGEFGLYNVLQRQHPDMVRVYQKGIDRLVASLAICSLGADDIKEFPQSAFEHWLSYFRDSSGLRWRTDIWPVSFESSAKCLKEITFAFAQYYQDPRLAKRARQSVITIDKMSSWRLLRTNPEAADAEWMQMFSEFEKVLEANPNRYRQMVLYFLAWKKSVAPNEDLVSFMTNANRRQSFAEYFKSKKVNTRDSVVYLSQASKFSEFINEFLNGNGQAKIVVPIVTQNELASARRAKKSEGGSPRKYQEAQSVPLPPRLHRMADEILSEGETGWPGKSKFFQEKISKNGALQDVYCPIIPAILHIPFKIPLRGAQVRRSDSGEGDLRIYDADKKVWRKNQSPNAGYWIRKFGKKAQQRGYAYHFDQSNPPITGFFVNTNKTGSPYLIPWQHDEAHKIYWEVAKWQEEWNPISNPISPDLYIQKGDLTEGETATGLPDIFPLFRMPPNSTVGTLHRPPSYVQVYYAWQRLMEEVQRRWNDINPEDQISIVSAHETTGQLFGAVYNQHGLRVAGLTNLYNNGVPLEILSKVVAGHHSLLMTLYYLKFEPSKIHEILSDAAVKQNDESIRAFIDEMKSLTFDEARRRSAVLKDDGLIAATSMHDAQKVHFNNMGIGLCPWDGTRCGDGGEFTHNVSLNGVKTPQYGKVEGGERNCILCRHLISGPAWNTQLWLLGTSLCGNWEKLNQSVTAMTEKLDELYKEKDCSTDRALRAGLQSKMYALENEINLVTSHQKTIEKGMFEVKRLLDKCHSIMPVGASENSDGTPLVVRDRDSIVEYATATKFEQQAIITAASRIYPMFQDTEMEMQRDQFLDRILYNSDMVPLSFRPLTERQKKAGLDAFARFVLERLSSDEATALHSGKLRLNDLNLIDELEKALPNHTPEHHCLAAFHQPLRSLDTHIERSI